MLTSIIKKKLTAYDLFNYLFIYICVFGLSLVYIFYDIFRRLSFGQIVLSDGMMFSENLNLTWKEAL